MDPNSQYELKDLQDLKPNPRNPRRISREDFAALQASIKRFGDLSCVVFNVRTQQLVGGHQRIEAIKANPQNKRVQILERYATPNQQGTVAIGKIWLDNEDYKYREVDWDEGTEKAANIAANRIQGEFDLDLLGQMDYELSQLENGTELLELTGQSDSEIKKLMKSVGVEEAPAEPEKPENETETNKLEFALTAEQREVVEEALNNLKATRDMAAEKNSSLNGNALYYMARDYLDQLHAAAEPTTPQPAAEPAQPETPADA